MKRLANAFQFVLAALTRLELSYLVGGSIASASHGIPRSTIDIDFLVALDPATAHEFSDLLRPEFHVDREVALAGRPFTVIHSREGYKFDFFPARSAFDQSQLARRVWTQVHLPGLEEIEFAAASAEDIMLSKLVWFRKGGEVSDRQWHDVLGVATIQGSKLDMNYLQQWATWLGVDDLLARALRAP